MKTINVKDLMSISGKSGLFRYLAQARNGVVVESLADSKRHIAPATARVSSLEDIAIFTTGEEVPLSDVFMKIHEKEDGGAAPDQKALSSDALKSYFAELLPEYDEERVYLSDIKKVVAWYNQLHELELLEVVDKEEEEEEKEEDKPVEEKPEKGNEAADNT